MKTIRPQELDRLRTQGHPLELIDVRTPVEYREVHVPFARNLPLSDLDPGEIRRTQKSGESLYVICKSGGRGAQAGEKLIAAGCQDVVNVEGGTQAWVDAGLPVIRGRKAVSLERQVRIAAGLLVLVGVALGYFVHEGFLGLAAFVGAGLVFAGVIDTCGMGMILARMPWNRVKVEPPTPSETRTDGKQACPMK
jgi:rhodanese-related sulfurtransferase